MKFRHYNSQKRTEFILVMFICMKYELHPSSSTARVGDQNDALLWRSDDQPSSSLAVTGLRRGPGLDEHRRIFHGGFQPSKQYNYHRKPGGKGKGPVNGKPAAKKPSKLCIGKRTAFA